MSWLLQMMEQYSVAAVFANVLVEQASALTPGPLSDAGADGRAGSRRQICGVDPVPMAVPAALIADTGWYLAGRRYDRGILSLLCRLSLFPDSCVR